jgi:hypothetical protein
MLDLDARGAFGDRRESHIEGVVDGAVDVEADLDGLSHRRRCSQP